MIKIKPDMIPGVKHLSQLLTTVQNDGLLLLDTYLKFYIDSNH